MGRQAQISLRSKRSACDFECIVQADTVFIIGDVINKLLNGEKNFSVYLIEIAMIAASFVIAEIFHSISTAFHTKLLSAYSVRFVKKPATNFQECRSDMLKIHHRVRLRT